MANVANISQVPRPRGRPKPLREPSERTNIMARKKKHPEGVEDPVGRRPIPPGATQEASDRTSRPGGPPATPLDDRHAIGTPGGGSEIGGLAGTNEGEGDPDDTEALEE